MKRKVYQHLASLLQARENCAAAGNSEWYRRHTDTLNNILREALPCGGGIDSGTKLDFTKSTPERLVLFAPFHHMNEHGYYDGWTDHQIIVTPSLASGFNLRVTGRNKNDIKDYLGEVYQQALSEDVDDVKYYQEVA